jgi:hypothetical protein
MILRNLTFFILHITHLPLDWSHCSAGELCVARTYGIGKHSDRFLCSSTNTYGTILRGSENICWKGPRCSYKIKPEKKSSIFQYNLTDSFEH